MGLLEQQSQGLLPATANPKMLAQALKARQQPRTQLTGQGLLDTAAIGLSPIPVIGDLLGLGADANRFINEPESRTPLNFGLAALGLIPFVPPLVSAGLGKFAQSQGKTLAQTPTGPARNQAGAIVYHGSPHKFDAFDSSKIGTGEGAQAYGHGLYFAENPAVAQEYKEAISNAKAPELYRARSTAKLAQKDIDQITGWLDGSSPWPNNTQGKPVSRDFLEKRLAEYKDDMKWSNDVMQNRAENGVIYKVDLPDEAIAKMLDWDKPLIHQSDEIKNLFKQSMPQGAYQSALMQRTGDAIQGLEMYSGGRAKAADKLKNSGIPGVKYLDGGSRGAGDGTRNFVVFPGNEGLLKILERQ